MFTPLMQPHLAHQVDHPGDLARLLRLPWSALRPPSRHPSKHSPVRWRIHLRVHQQTNPSSAAKESCLWAHWPGVVLKQRHGWERQQVVRTQAYHDGISRLHR